MEASEFATLEKFDTEISTQYSILLNAYYPFLSYYKFEMYVQEDIIVIEK